MGNLAKDFQSEANRFANDGCSGIAFCNDRFIRNDCRMAAFAKFLPRLDGGELAAFCKHVVCLEHSALYADAVSSVYPYSARGQAKLVDKRPFDSLVDSFPIIIYHAVCQRLVGFLILGRAC